MHRFHLKINYLLKNELTELYITHALRSFALSMIALFLPIFFLRQGFSIMQVLFFYVISCIIGTVACYYAIRYAAKKGVKHSIIMSIPLIIIFFLVLYNFDILSIYINEFYLAIISFFIVTISNAYYYMGLHIDFTKSSSMKKSAKDLGMLNSLSILLSIMGPLLGAFIISFFSFKILFLIVITILIIAVIPLFFSNEIHDEINVDIKNIFSKQNSKEMIPYFAEGYRDHVARIFWPLLIFFLGLNLKEMGGLFTFSNFILAGLTYYMGKKTIEANKHHILNLGVKLHSLTLVLRVMFSSVTYIALIQGFGAATFTLVTVPFQSIFYNNSKKKGINHIYLREVFLHAGRFLSLISGMILIYFLKNNILSLIIVILLGAISTLFMSKLKDLVD